MATSRRGPVSPQASPLEAISRWSISTCSTLDLSNVESITSDHTCTPQPSTPHIWVHPPSPTLGPCCEADTTRVLDVAQPFPARILTSRSQPASEHKSPRPMSKPLPKLPAHARKEDARTIRWKQSKSRRTPKRSASVLRKTSSLASSRWSFVPGHQDPKEANTKRRETITSEAPDPISIDISSLEGQFGCHDHRTRSPSSDMGMKYEAHGILTGGLGTGMDHVVNAQSSDDLPKRANTKHRSLRFRRTLRDPAEHQLTADKLGEIVAVDGEVGVDLSNLDGGNLKNEDDVLTTADQCRSYYFPSDPQMPDWKPFPMRHWFILLLISMALMFAAIQEYLCQRSGNMENTPQGGLLSFVDIQDVNNLEFFAWRYLPTIIFVTYGAMWQSTNYEVQRLEPFYQLSRPGGALASQSLNIDYITSWSFLAPVKAFHYRHWAVMVSSCSTLLASGLVPILQSAALNLYPDRAAQKPGQPKYVRIDPVWSRLTEAGLLAAAMGGLVLLFQLRRKSGLLSDPKGIAGIAAMANRSHILNDFRGLDMAGYDIIHEQLKKRRYILHKSALWQGEYINSCGADTTEPRNRQNPHPIMLRLTAGASYIIFLVFSMVMLPVIMFTNANSATETLPWLLTTLATAIKLIWNTLDLNVRGLEPFYVLSCRNAPPSTLTMDYTGTVPGWMPLHATLSGHYLVAAVGFGAILTEVLVVCVSSLDVDGKVFAVRDALQGLHYNSTETLHSFWTSFGLALAILLYISITAVVVYMKRRHAFLPRQPTTIASILAFIYQSHMLYSFVTPEDWPKEQPRIEELDSRKMTEHLQKIGRTYGIGWYQGRDGLDHLGIDEEPLLSDYVHGEDWREGRVREVGGWDAY